MPTERVERKLAAILVADVAGYSRLMGIDEEGTLSRLKAHRRELIDPKIAEHRGRVVKSTGDGLLVEFPSVVEAVRCAVDLQRGMVERNAQISNGKRIEFRIGINLGDVIIDGEDIHGDGVNIAARLEGLAEPNGVCVSLVVRDQVRDRLELSFEDIGEQYVKNIIRPVRVFRIAAPVAAHHAASVEPALALPDKPSIAVLPFQNMSGAPEQEYFADGIVEEIITALSRFRQLFVIARNSSFTYKGRAVDVKQVGRELGVRYVLEGSVRNAGNRLRIIGQLADALTGAHLWADRFEGSLEDVFELQDQVTARVVGAIAPMLERAEIERARRKRTDNLDAYDFFLRGMARLHQYASREANADALRLFKRAVELDQEFPSAYAMAAYCYLLRKNNGWMINVAEEIGEAESLVRRALELGRDEALSVAMSGCVLASVVRDLDAGVAVTERALALNPNLAAAWLCGGWMKIWLGEPDAGIERLARAMRLSPLDPYIPRMQSGMAHAHFFAGRYDEASSWAAMALRASPDFHDVLRISAAIDALAGRLEEARKAVRRLQQIDPALRISVLKEMQGPYRRTEDTARYEEGLRRAGLPE